MVNELFKLDKVCPFWSGESLKCRLCNDGLFIPLDDHIEVYCKTVNFPQCLQYSLYAESNSQSPGEKNNTGGNRRKYRRVETHHKMILVKSANSEELITHPSTIAQTLDVSMGGMRLAIDDPFVSDTIVQFSFDDSFPESLQAGKGKVEWCNKQIDEPGYQVGLSFQGKQSIDIMGFYLGLHN